MRRILIVNVNWRGDVLFSTPFIRTIRENYPRSFIACLVVSRCAPILKNNPHLDEIIVFDEQRGLKGLGEKLRLIRILRARRFDTALLLHRSLSRTLICWLAGIARRVGYHTKKRGWILTTGLAQPEAPLHKVELFLHIARELGMAIRNKDYELFTGQADRQYIDSLLQQNNLPERNFLVAVNPGGNWELKRWPKENFARLSDRLIEAYRAKVIITGSGQDIDLARQINKLMKNPGLILCGQTSLTQLAALMQRMKLVIANDSGPMHIAVSQGTPVIALFGPTDPAITGPYGCGRYIVIRKGGNCEIPCYRLDCPDNRCMREVSVDDVWAAVEKLLPICR